MTYDFRTASEKLAQEKMPQDKLIEIFDSLKSGQKVKVVMRAVMGHGDSENGAPTVFTVGRRGKGKRGETITLLREGQTKVHQMVKITLYKSRNYNGEMAVNIAIGDMGATLYSLEKA